MIPEKKRRLHRYLRWGALLLLSFTLLAVMGCDDTSSREAVLEDARISIDKGDYDGALTILENMTGQDVLEVRASAYAGKAGLDTFEILGEIGDDTKNAEGFDVVGKMLGAGAGGTLSADDIDSKRSSMDLAKQNLLDSVGGDETKLDDDNKTKLAIYAITGIVLEIGDAIQEDYNKDEIELTKEWLKTFDGGGNSYATLSADAAKIDKNLGYIGQAIVVLAKESPDNDIEQEFTEFMQEIDPGNDGVSDTDLKNYLTNLENR